MRVEQESTACYEKVYTRIKLAFGDILTKSFLSEIMKYKGTYSMTEYSSEHPAERYSIPLYSSYPFISILLWSHCVPEKNCLLS